MAKASSLLAGPGFDAARLASIKDAFEERESAGEGDKTTKAHKAWLESPQGKADVAYMVEHFGRIREFDRVDLALELARTAQPEILPFLHKALEYRWEGKNVLSGIYVPCRYGNAGKEFRIAIAPSVVRWLAEVRDESESSIEYHGIENSIELLPLLDQALAAKVLLTDKYVSPNSRHVAKVLGAFNKARLTVPLEQIEPVLAVMQLASKSEDSKYEHRTAYRNAVAALAIHQPERALKLVDDAMKAVPGESYWWSDVALAAAGLTGIYECLCRHTDTGADFDALPNPGKLYFAVRAFQNDTSNGGIGQALHNPTGDLYPLVKQGYEAIGDKRGSDWLEAMCKPFGEKGPALKQQDRIRQMEAMQPDYWEQEEALSDAWEAQRSKLYKHHGTEWLLAKYAVQHAAVLRPLFAEGESKAK